MLIVKLVYQQLPVVHVTQILFYTYQHVGRSAHRELLSLLILAKYALINVAFVSPQLIVKLAILDIIYILELVFKLVPSLIWQIISSVLAAHKIAINVHLKQFVPSVQQITIFIRVSVKKIVPSNTIHKIKFAILALQIATIVRQILFALLAQPIIIYIQMHAWVTVHRDFMLWIKSVINATNFVLLVINSVVWHAKLIIH